MKPIGLTFKRFEINRYTGKMTGDLMIIHECVGCGRISCNRISGDDNAYILINTLKNSASVRGATRAILVRIGIIMLSITDIAEVNATLFGRRDGA